MLWNIYPLVMRQMSGQQEVNQAYRPEDPVNKQPEYTMVIIPANHGGIYAKKKINDRIIPVPVCHQY